MVSAGLIIAKENQIVVNCRTVCKPCSN